MVQIDLVSCLITPDWAASAASYLNALQLSQCTAELRQESALIEQLVYKNINQHRVTRPFQRLEQVRRLLRLARQADIDAAVTSVRDALTLCSKSTITVIERTIPSAQSAVIVLRRLLGYCRLAQSLIDASLGAAFQFSTQLAQSFFMPLSLTCLAVLARVRALSSQLLLDCIKIYNSAIELIDILPLDAGLTELELFRSQLSTLPQTLKCNWHNNRPTVEELAWPEASIGGQKDNVRVVARPQAIGGAKLERKSSKSGDDQLPVQPPTASIGALGVVEDRGVAISREELMAELRRGETMAATDVVMPIEMAPEYARQEQMGIGGASGGGASKSVLGVKKTGKRVQKVKILESDDTAAPKLETMTKKKEALSSRGAKPAVAALPQRSTAFISVESLQKKKPQAALPSSSKQKEERSHNKTKDDGASNALPPAADPAVNRSWEDWLAPLGGGSSAGDGKNPESAGNKKGKKRRR